jgi:hypothetical protein
MDYWVALVCSDDYGALVPLRMRGRHRTPSVLLLPRRETGKESTDDEPDWGWACILYEGVAGGVGDSGVSVSGHLCLADMCEHCAGRDYLAKVHAPGPCELITIYEYVMMGIN